MATGGDIDTSELAELWSEEHISQLPTFEHFHNIHQIKVEESLDALPAKLIRTLKTCLKNQNTNVSSSGPKIRKKEIHHVRKCTGHQV